MELSRWKPCRQAEGMDATNTRRHFLRVATTVSMAEAPDEKRPQIGESEIILAFPIDDAGKAIATADCATFAFLPIRDFGFRFCVQAKLPAEFGPRGYTGGPSLEHLAARRHRPQPTWPA